MLTILADGPHGRYQIASAMLSLVVCDEHRTPLADIYLTGHGWDDIAGMLRRAGLAPPPPENILAEYIRTDDPASLAFERALMEKKP